jgi:aminoglycoside phosphotransferase (APT) family kinase protein
MAPADRLMTPHPPDDLVEALLLRFLQTKLRQPDLRYLTFPARFAGGFENRVYGFQLRPTAQPFSGPLVLRLLAQHGDVARVHHEFALQNALADLGFPAPRVFVSEDDVSILGGPFTIMERLRGTAAYTNTIRLSNALPMWVELSLRAPRQRAEIQARLHALDADVIARKMEDAGIAPATLSSRLEEIRKRIELDALSGLRPGIDWLLEHRPPNDVRLAVCHGDLWGGNLLSERSRITGVLDWSMATLAPAELDVANTSVGMRYAVPQMPAALRAFLRPIQYDGSLRYLREYRRRRQVDQMRLQYFTALRCLDMCSRAYRRRHGVAGAVRDDLKVWDPPGSTDGFEACFRRNAGVSLAMPPERIHFLY